MKGSSFEHEPLEKDYLAALQTRLAGKEAVTSVEIRPGNKLGAASADLRCNGQTVTIDHDGFQVVVSTPNPSAAAAEVKRQWSQMRGPKLRDRTGK